MAQSRNPRQPPSPPNRSRARTPGKGQMEFDMPEVKVRPPQSRGGRPKLSLEEAQAIVAARAGPSSELLTYSPTPSINPPRPRTLEAGYDTVTETLYVRFRNGSVYGYYNVPPRVWKNFRRVKSPGRFINRTLNYYPYNPEQLS